MPTATAEDYLERIYALIEEKGYARVSDIAEALQVRPSTVHADGAKARRAKSH